MDVYLVVIRLIHIVAAFVWFGTGFYSTIFLFPTLIKMGADANNFVQVLVKNRLFGMIFPVSAVLTVLAGILLYLKPDVPGHFSSAGWAAISIGAVAGILAAGHGGAVLGRMTGEYIGKLSAGTTPASELTTLGQKLVMHANISMVLLVIAMLGMETARYIF
jgi:uncharacterized membrane protein